MAKQPESRLQKRIQQELVNRYPGIHIFKVHGGPFMPAGIPDLLASFLGRYIALEVKLPRSSSKPSEIQLKTIERIRKSGGVAGVVRSVEEACWYVEASTKLGLYRIDPKTECWQTEFYRKFVIVRGKRYRLYRLYYHLYREPIKPGMFICHSCDNPYCVNPDHLWQGTTQDNTKDKIRKGRQKNGASPGELNGGAKLTRKQVEEIRARYIPRVVSMAKLAKEYGVAKSQISFIIKGKSWQ